MGMGQLITALSISSPEANTLTFDGTNFIVSSITGLEFPVTRLPRFNLPGSSGAFISNALYGERAINIKGTINAPDNTVNTFLSNRTTFIDALSYARDSSNNLQPQTLTITLANGQILTTNVYVDKAVTVGFSPDQLGWEDFIISLIAPDPNLYSSIANVTTISLLTSSGGAVPATVPMSLAAGTGGSAAINNVGSAASFPVITLSSPLFNPYIWNSRTGAFLNIQYTLNPGDTALVIDCNAQTITQGTNNLNGIQTTDSSFWNILSGINTVFFRASGGIGTCSISFFPTFVGI